MARTPQPDADKARAIKLAGHAAKKAAKAESDRAAAIRFASEQGASLRELEAATGISHMTIKRLLER